MRRLVVVSNRIPAGRASGAGGELELPAGGLVTAIVGALRALPESLWIGWDSRARDGEATTTRFHEITLYGMPLARREVERFYDGFCNQALWPLLHCFPGRASFDLRHLASYLDVQERFAEWILARLDGADAVWVHDYHLLGVAAALRRRGCTARLGFFLHTPFPPDELWSILPHSARFLEALADYDLIGFQTRRDLENYTMASRRELGALVDGDRLRVGARRQRFGVYPVGIDPASFRPGPRTPRREGPSRLQRLVGGRRVVLGVDRLDYTKGLVERFRGFELFLRRHPDWHDRVCLVQVASPSRANLRRYRAERAELEGLVGRINGEFSRVSWVPMRYLYRNYSQRELILFYRGADVGLVTPLRDGMNLVAKEFVAAQRPETPGVLVLSRFAGAAERMDGALLINPYLAEETADAIERALRLSLDERRDRHRALLGEVEAACATEWARRYLADLAS